MSGMNMELAAMYGTPGGPSTEDLQKQANAELFCKLAADNGIDLNSLSDEQVQELYDATFSTKTAEKEEEKKDEKKEEKKEEGKDEKKEEGKHLPPWLQKKEAAAAAAEFDAVKEAEAKFAEADYLGRVMAHAYVNELSKIGEAMEKKEEHEKKETKAEEKKEEEKKGSASVPAAIQKVASARPTGNIDSLALEAAVVKAAEAGLDANEVANRLNAVVTLGKMGPSEKIAAAQDLAQAVDVRALEYLEAAGYPVNWE